ncbi:MAG: DUF3786 domain-containing protein [Dethiobacteria bacterium]|nr:DUF3786 domain-containing protein [Bacillota bacterium]MDW7729564.1 DUF3786 domain-containing protein [Bacillota bacterium]
MRQENKRKNIPELDRAVLDNKKRKALVELCEKYKVALREKDPQVIARLAAISLHKNETGTPFFVGEHLLETHRINWPELSITDSESRPVSLQTEALWLHYLNKADGHPLEGRWVNLSEIGGLFYQQAFQGYCGDELAEEWGDNIEGLRKICLSMGGWSIPGLTDLAFEWRVLPRLPLCLCYRKPMESSKAWATMLFDASAHHYVAADVAATVGKALADRLKQKEH